MGARRVAWLVDLWARLTCRPGLWTWRERRAAVRAAEDLLHQHYLTALRARSERSRSGR
ncbi:MAG: hypothetical protein IRY97_02280 [Thermomicrobiaceae bacterium]|nr:hypothetical protein [Thermomicrobiaceae bacterium]